jgi:hypothetical protein
VNIQFSTSAYLQFLVLCECVIVSVQPIF